MAFLIVAYAPKAISYTILFDEVNSAIKNNDYEKAIHLTELYYDSDVVYKSDDYTLAIYSAVSKKTENKETVLTKKYVGIIKGVSKSVLNKNIGKSEAKILLNDSYEIEIVDTDIDSDGFDDTVSTLVNYDFIYFDIPFACLENINKLEIIDKEGASYSSYNMNLSFNESFFTDIEGLVKEFEENKTIEEANSDQFLSIKDSYKRGSFKAIYIKAQRKTFLYMILFVFVALVFYDVGLGLHLTWIPFKWAIKKVKKQPKETVANDISHTKYEGNTQLIVKANVPEGFIKQIKIKYECEDSSFEIILRKSQDYQTKIITKANTYLLNSEFSEFEIKGLPTKLVLDRFIMNLNLTIYEGSLSDGTNITKTEPNE
jgi:hypothetical protein